MKDQMYFARERRNIEREYARIENEFLAFVAEELRTADLTTAEKYTLLTAFVEDMTGDIYTRGQFARMEDNTPMDKTAVKLLAIRDSYIKEYSYQEKMDAIVARERALDKESSEQYYEDMKNAGSPLFV